MGKKDNIAVTLKKIHYGDRNRKIAMHLLRIFLFNYANVNLKCCDLTLP